MRNSGYKIVLWFILLMPAALTAQTVNEGLTFNPDSIFINMELDQDTTVTQEIYFLTPDEALITPDTIVEPLTGFLPDTIETKTEFKPDALKAVWWGAVIPGFGQIVNRKYWKLPIVYGGFMGCAFAISYTSERYNSFRTGYRDFMDNDPNTRSYEKFLVPGVVYNDETVKNFLKNRQDNYRRYRDLSIFITIAFYGLTVLEAYVDAQLYDYDISSDLSLQVKPTILNNDWGADTYLGNTRPPFGNQNAFGVQFSFTIK